MSATPMTWMLIQDAILWEISADGYDPYEPAGDSYEAPVDVRVRWDNVQDIVRTPEGEEVISKAKIMIDREVKVGSYIQLGTVDTNTPANPEHVEGAYPLIALKDVPSVDGLEVLYIRYI